MSRIQSVASGIASFVKKVGDTMTGTLTMSGSTTKIIFPDNSNSSGGLSFGSDNVLLYHSSSNQVTMSGELKLAIFSTTGTNGTGVTPIFVQGSTSQSAPTFVIQQASSQSGNMFEIRDSSSGTSGLVTSDGRLALRYIGAQSYTLAVGIGYDGYGGVFIKENSNTQSNPDIQIQNSSGSPVFNINVGGGVQSVSYVQPGNTSTSGGHIYSGSGAPNISGSVSGDYYFRTDTPSSANQRIYVATGSNTWSGIL